MSKSVRNMLQEALTQVEAVRQNLTTCSLCVVEQRNRAEAAEAERDRAISLIEDLRDEDDCRFDHHGYCQAHGWMDSKIECPHARARRAVVGKL